MKVLNQPMLDLLILIILLSSETKKYLMTNFDSFLFSIFFLDTFRFVNCEGCHF